MSASNEIILGSGDLINFDYVAKVMWGGDFPGVDATTSSKAKRLYIFHGGVVADGTSKGSQTAYDYGSAVEAKAVRDAILQSRINLGAIDFRAKPAAGAATVNNGVTPTVQLTSYTASPSGSDSNTAHANINGCNVTIAGSGFTGLLNLLLVDGTNVIPVTFVSSTTIQAALPAYAAGTVNFDFRYTDTTGTVQTISAAISITFS